MSTYNAKSGTTAFVLGEDANGLPAIFASGQATDSAGIITQTGAAATIADGSLYLSTVDGAGVLFLKTNDVWIDQL
ncbi:MAG: hypothetical protein WC558_15245 [Patulibacter sp.]